MTMEPMETMPEPIASTAIIRIKPDLDVTVIEIYTEGLRLLKYAKTRVIKTDTENKEATDDLAIIRSLRKKIEAVRKEYTVPINDHLKTVNDTFKDFTAPLQEADTLNEQKMLAYRRAQEGIRAEQERINALRIEAAKAEMELKGELTESVNVVEVQPEPARVTRGGLGASGMVDNWKAEVTDFALLSDDYKLPNMVALNALAKSVRDTREIPGIRVYNDPHIRVTK